MLRNHGLPTLSCRGNRNRHSLKGSTTPGSGAPLRITGFNEAAWDDEHLFLIGRGVSWIQGGGETHGLAAWAFDPGSGMFRSVTITDSGATAVGTARYDAATDSWRAQMTTHGPSGKTLWKGRIRFIDPNTKEERWTAYACGGLVKKMQITKTERRKRQP